MRKTVLASLALLLCLLSSCGAASAPPDSGDAPCVQFSGTYEISCGDFSFTASLTAQPDAVSLRYLAPDSLAGCKIAGNRNEYIYEVEGVTSIRRAADSPGDGVAPLLFPLLYSLLGTAPCADGKGGYQIQTDRGTAVLDGTGTVLSFSDAAEKINAILVRAPQTESSVAQDV